MKKKLSYFILFLLLNFGALALGSILMGGSPMENTWYQNLPKAPWTPPGYVFGVAWSSIMICFSLFMARLMTTNNWKLYLQIYVLQGVPHILRFLTKWKLKQKREILLIWMVLY